MFGNNPILLSELLNVSSKSVLGIGSFFVLLIVFIYILKKTQTISDLKEENHNLSSTLEKLDQQAKIILKSDMDVKLYQQEIKDRGNKLNLLRRFISTSLPILSKNQLFSKIDNLLIEKFGFKKGLLLDFDSLEQLYKNNFDPVETQAIVNILLKNKSYLKEKKILTSESEICKTLSFKLHTKNILICPIKTKNKIYNIFIVAGLISSESIKESTKEAFLILCMYLAKCLDNIDLFEQIYQTKESLEKKIKNRTKELAKSLKTVETISKTKSDFISNVSHELRTPLTSVKGFSSLLADEKFGKLPQEASKRLKKIVENVDKLMDIVNTLLDISRIESGKIEINITLYDIVPLIKNIADFFEPQSNEKNIAIDIDTPETFNVYMDKNLIERVLTNLVNNAIKFTPEGGKIKISCKEKEEKALISIADTGFGISKENLDKIFQEFYRIKDVEKKSIKGSGLGLSLVKKIIDSHKQKIWVESELNKGTTFYFTLERGKNE
ncbi:MAG: HAMP domain-containing histidine kinase [Candidatus Omnitrophica bacterium]|nr:HAMP domain-containing histidine kinase [Candidatus Omnitrophota bacterium]MCF7893666.1 HAMP domain-containing histidine kinase [Candidatus Omnitrophota bacterium]